MSIFKDLKKADRVFLRHEGPKGMLQLPHDGPFVVVTRDDKNFTIRVHDKNITVLIDRIKRDTGETIRQPMATQSMTTQAHSWDNERVTDQEQSKINESRQKRVRLPERFQAGR